MRVLGIDPGLHGALAVVGPDGLEYCAHFVSVEAKGRGRELLLPMLWKDFQTAGLFGLDTAFIERVQAMPKQGASSGFKFGKTAGHVEAFCAAAGVPYDYAEPRLWMKFFHLQGRNDDQALATACRMFPDKSDQFMPERNRLTKQQAVGKADAALIALWGYRFLTR